MELWGTDLYLKQYGIDINCEIASIFDLNDTEKLNCIKMILDNLEQWWGACIHDKQEELEYKKLNEIYDKYNELIELRRKAKIGGNE